MTRPGGGADSAGAGRAGAMGRVGELAPLVGLPLLNLADALFTGAYLKAGLATEANPVMAAAWDGSPLLFLTVKLLLVTGCVVFLWLQRHRPAASRALQIGLALYLAIVAFHLLFLGIEVPTRALG